MPPFHAVGATRFCHIAAGIAFVVAALAVDRAFGADTRPNILLIVADDMGFSDAGCYGGEIDTPRLDRLATEGAMFTRMYSTGRCCPSRASLMTGRYAHAVDLGHMTIDLKRPGYRGRVKPGIPTIADTLRRAGYATWLSGKWHLGTSDPTAHGFDNFFGTLVSCKDFWSPDRFYRIKREKPRAWNRDAFFATDHVTDFALEFVKEARTTTPEKPWFGYVAYHAPHFPLHAPSEDIAKYADLYHVGWDVIRQRRLERQIELGLFDASVTLPPRSMYRDWASSEDEAVPAWASLSLARRADLARRMAIYAAMIDRLDREIGRLLDDISAAGETDETVIMFLSDNGACAEWDPFGFDGVSGPDNHLHVDAELSGMGQAGTFHSVGAGWAMASNTPFQRYKHFCREGGIRGPCLVRMPGTGSRGRGRAGQRVSRPSHLIDVFPTLVEIAQVPSTDRPKFDGRSLLRALVGDTAERGDQQQETDFSAPLFFEHEGHRAVIYGNRKLVATRGGDWEYFDLADDPCETHSLNSGGSPFDEPAVAAEVDLLTTWWNEWATANNVTPLPDDYGVKYLDGSADRGGDRMKRDNRPTN